MIFVAEQVYLKLQVIDLKIKEATTNSKGPNSKKLTFNPTKP